MVLSARRIQLVAAVLAAAAALTGCTSAGQAEAHHDERRAGGPIETTNQHVWTKTVALNEPFTDGVEVLVVGGNRPAVLDGVHLVGAKGIRLLGVRLVEPGRSWGSIMSMPWPPRDPDLDPCLVVSADGATLAPQHDGTGYELLLGLKARGRGYFVRKGIRVDYTVGEDRYSRFVPAVLGICSGMKQSNKPCPEPKGWHHFPES